MVITLAAATFSPHSESVGAQKEEMEKKNTPINVFNHTLVRKHQPHTALAVAKSSSVLSVAD